MKNNITVEDGNETELLCTRVTLLLKVTAGNNTRNAMRNHLEEILGQSQHRDRHITFLQWYSSKNNYSVVPIKQPNDVYQDFKSLQTYSTLLNPKQHTKQKPEYTPIFLCHSDDITQLQKDTSFWFENSGHNIYKKTLQCEKTM